MTAHAIRPEQARRALFVGLSCVGDAVMSTAVLEALHQACPAAVVDIVTDPRSEGVFAACPYRGELIYKDKTRFLRGAPALVRKLWARRYDIIVDIRTDGLAWLLRGTRRFTKLGSRPYGGHAIEEMMGVVRELHGNRPVPATRFWLTAADQDYAASTLESLSPARLLALGPGCGGKRPQKFWPVARYRELAARLADRFDAVMLLGGQGDRQLCQEISAGLPLPCLDMSGLTTLAEVAALLGRADFFVGSDSGLGHVAGAVGVPTLTFFSVDDPERCLPRGPNASWLMGPDRDARQIGVEEAEAALRAAAGAA